MATRKVPTYCYQCVAGPDLLNVVVEDGVAVKVEPNFGVKEHPAGGRPCVRAYSLVRKLYNPNRVKTPMKRTNPNKGKEHDRVGPRSRGTKRSTCSPTSCAALRLQSRSETQALSQV